TTTTTSINEKRRFKSYSLWLLSDPFPKLPWENIIRIIVRIYQHSTFRCSVCLCEEFFLPFMTPCGHIFCGNCLLHCLFEHHPLRLQSQVQSTDATVHINAYHAVPVDFWKDTRGPCPLCQFYFHFQQCRIVVFRRVHKFLSGELIDFVLVEREYGTELLQAVGYEHKDYNTKSLSPLMQPAPSDNHYDAKEKDKQEQEQEQEQDDEKEENNNDENFLWKFRRFDVVNVKQEVTRIEDMISQVGRYMKSVSSDDYFEMPFLASLSNYLKQFQLHLLELESYPSSSGESPVQTETTAMPDGGRDKMNVRPPNLNHVYQSIDGQYLFLDPLNWNMLRAEYSRQSYHRSYHRSRANPIQHLLPKYLKNCKILQIEKFTFTPHLKQQFKWLSAILPYNANFAFVEIDMTQLVSPQVLRHYQSEIDEKARVRQLIEQEKLDQEAKLVEEERQKEAQKRVHEKPLDITSFETFPSLLDMQTYNKQQEALKKRQFDKSWSDLLKPQPNKTTPLPKPQKQQVIERKHNNLNNNKRFQRPKTGK
ncbi:Zinc finger protein, partial [Reticulomyxa filosa]